MNEAAATGAPNTQTGNDANAGGQPAGASASNNAANGTQGGQPNAPQGAAQGNQGEIDFTFDFPEDMPVDEEELNAFKATAKELGLDQDKAKKLVDLRVQAAQAAMRKHAEAVGKWRTDSQADKEFGGEKFEENLGVAKLARDKFATPELVSLLQSSRLGDHPEVIRFFYRVGKAISQDTFVRPGATTGSERKPDAEVFYGLN